MNLVNLNQSVIVVVALIIIINAVNVVIWYTRIARHMKTLYFVAVAFE